jgi:hypothetical protein
MGMYADGTRTGFVLSGTGASTVQLPEGVYKTTALCESGGLFSHRVHLLGGLERRHNFNRCVARCTVAFSIEDGY